MKRHLLVSAACAAALVGGATAASAGTAVPGHEGKTSGVVVGHYTAYYWEDSNGDFVWDLGDGRAQSSFSGWYDGADVADWVSAERAELADDHTSCRTVVNYKGDFGGDPYLDMGSIQNHDVCVVDGTRETANALIVSETDPRYTGDPDHAIWGTWEYHVDARSGAGNLVAPSHDVG